MKVDGGLVATSLAEVPARRRSSRTPARRASTAETAHDPFLPQAIAAEHTRRVELGTGIVVAFARNP